MLLARQPHCRQSPPPFHMSSICPPSPLSWLFCARDASCTMRVGSTRRVIKLITHIADSTTSPRQRRQGGEHSSSSQWSVHSKKHGRLMCSPVVRLPTTRRLAAAAVYAGVDQWSEKRQSGGPQKSQATLIPGPFNPTAVERGSHHKARGRQRR